MTIPRGQSNGLCHEHEQILPCQNCISESEDESRPPKKYADDPVSMDTAMTFLKIMLANESYNEGYRAALRSPEISAVREALYESNCLCDFTPLPDCKKCQFLAALDALIKECE